MRIGVMLRDIGNQLNAPGIIVLNLVEHLLRLDSRRHYVLFLPHAGWIPRFTGRRRVTPVVVRAPVRLLWDQLAVPLAARRAGVDLLFHPKHSIPLASPCPTVMHLRGDEYWVFPEHFERLDLAYQKLFLPRFCRRATHLIAESDSVRAGFQRRLGIPDARISRIHLAADDRFHAPVPEAARAACRARFALPARYLLTVTRVIEGKRRFYPGKNIVRILEAYRESTARRHAKLVIVGRKTRAFIRRRLGPSDDLLNDLIVLDAVPQAELPALYAMAEGFLFPSIYESFGIPLVEAMASGCPVITSTTFACPEVAGGAALLVDPERTVEIRQAMDRLCADPALRDTLARQGRAQAARFTWRRAAQEHLELFDRLARGTARAASTPEGPLAPVAPGV